MSAPLPDGTGTILLPFHREAGHLVCLFAQGDTAGKMWGLHLGPTLSEPSAVDHWTFPELTTFPQFSGGSFTNLPPLSPHLPGLTCHPPLLQKYPQPPGWPQKRAVKYGLGGITTFALVFLMWFPLVYMSLVKTVGGVTNQPLKVSVKITINGYEVSGGEGRERVPVLGRRKGMG